MKEYPKIARKAGTKASVTTHSDLSVEIIVVTPKCGCRGNMKIN